MTLRMGDGPVENLPPGLDAYAGYTNQSGIGATWPRVVLIPAPHHLSITTDGSAAMTADVESGAMKAWTGYPVGYCAVSNVEELVTDYGRPRKLWTAHRDPSIGAHICSPSTCAYPGLTHTADGTQWTNHGGVWDESLLLDDFFSFLDPPAPPPPAKDSTMLLPVLTLPDGTDIVAQVAAGNQGYVKGRPPADQWTQNTNYVFGPVAAGTVPVARITAGQYQLFYESAADQHVYVVATNDGVTWGTQMMG